MGERHQIYVIARIRPHAKSDGQNDKEQVVDPTILEPAATPTPEEATDNTNPTSDKKGTTTTRSIENIGNSKKLRCIAGGHHQWCYGPSAPKDVYKFLKLCQNSQNAAIIRAELSALDGKFGTHGRVEPCIPHQPCPFVSHLLYIAQSEARGPAHLLSAQTDDLFEGDSNDGHGVSVIDVTDPTAPRYCHVMDVEPLTASQYMMEEGVAADKAAKMASLLEVFELIEPEDLAEAFGGRYTRSGLLEEMASGTKFAPLATMTYRIALETALANGDLSTLPDIADDLSIIRVRKELLMNRNTIDGAHFELLKLYLAKDSCSTICDLTPFNIPASVLPSVVKSLQNIKSLLLSPFTTGLNSKVLHELGKTIPQLETLYLPGDVDMQMKELAAFYASSNASFYIIHPALLETLPKGRASSKPKQRMASRFGVMKAIYNSNSVAVSAFTIPFWNSASILQIIADVMCWSTQDGVVRLVGPEKRLNSQKIHMSTSSRPADVHFESRPIVCFPDKVFGPGEDMSYPSRFDKEFKIPEDMDCWMLILEPHLKYEMLMRSGYDDLGVGEQAPYAFARVKDGRICESFDFDQFLTILGYGEVDKRTPDTTYWIEETKKAIDTEAKWDLADNDIKYYRQRGLRYVSLDELVTLVDALKLEAKRGSGFW